MVEMSSFDTFDRYAPSKINAVSFSPLRKIDLFVASCMVLITVRLRMPFDLSVSSSSCQVVQKTCELNMRPSTIYESQTNVVAC